MEETKEDSEDEHLEEGEEDMGVGEAAEDDGKEGGEAAVEDCRTNRGNCFDCFVLSRTLCHHESEPNVNGVVDAETYGQNYVDAGDDVNGDVPEVEEANDVGQGDADDAHDINANLNVCKKEEGDNEDAGHGKPDIPPELKADDLVRLPGSVHL